MRLSRGNAARGVVAAVLLGFFAFVLLVQFAPDSVAYSPNNYGWNGLEQVSSTFRPNFTTSLSGLPPHATLVVTQPSRNFTNSEAVSVRSFLDSGGTVLVADKSGVANTLLAAIGSEITIQSQYSLSDRTYNWKSSSVPTALVLPSAKLTQRFLANVTGIALDSPSPLQLTGGRAVAVAVTSQFSTSSAPGAPKGPFVVMASQRVGNGTLIVVGDPQFLLNSEWTIADNKVLVGNLFANTSVFIDASHWGASSVSQLKSEFGQAYRFVSSSPMRYIATLFVVGVALALVPGREPDTATTAFNERGRGGHE